MKYQDVEGNQISELDVSSGEVGHPFETHAVDLEGLMLTEKPHNETVGNLLPQTGVGESYAQYLIIIGQCLVLI